MSWGAADFRRLLGQLLPSGPLWQLPARGALDTLLWVWGDGLARTQAFVDALPVEADPRTTTQLLPEWEWSVGLPDGCLPYGGTTAQRRQAVVSRLRATGGASRDYFIGLARTLGYTVTIEEPAEHTWRVRSAETTNVTTFRAGEAAAGDPLDAFGNQQLECLISRAAPAHTLVLFAYGPL